MASIKSKDTKIEIKLRSILWNLGYRYRIHYPIIGKPDIVFPKERVAIFCDGVLPKLDVFGVTSNSTKLFHSLHEGQQPDHLKLL